MEFLLVGLVEAIKVPLYFYVLREWVESTLDGRAASGRLLGWLTVGRLALGLAAAVPMFVAGSAGFWALLDLPGTRESLWRSQAIVWGSYLAIYGSIRWVLWTIVAVWVRRPPRRRSEQERKYIAMGVGASFLADIPLILVMGHPLIGKIGC